MDKFFHKVGETVSTLLDPSGRPGGERHGTLKNLGEWFKPPGLPGTKGGEELPFQQVLLEDRGILPRTPFARKFQDETGQTWDDYGPSSGYQPDPSYGISQRPFGPDMQEKLGLTDEDVWELFYENPSLMRQEYQRLFGKKATFQNYQKFFMKQMRRYQHLGLQERSEAEHRQNITGKFQLTSASSSSGHQDSGATAMHHLNPMPHAMPEQEVKQLDFNIGATITPTYTILGGGPLNLLERGIGDALRSGRGVKFLSLFLTCYYTSTGLASNNKADHSNMVRLFVFIDKRPPTDGGIPPIANIMKFPTTTNALRNVDFMERYKIIMTRRIVIRHDTHHDGTNLVSIGEYIPWDYATKLNLVTSYSNPEPSFDTKILANGLYIFAASEATTPGVGLTMQGRLRYIDWNKT